MHETNKIAQNGSLEVFSGTWEWRSEKLIPVMPESFFGLYLRCENGNTPETKCITGQYIYKKRGRKVMDSFSFSNEQKGIVAIGFDGEAVLLEMYDEKNARIGEARFEIVNEEQNLAVWTLKSFTGSFPIPQKQTMKRMRSLPR